MFFGELWLSRLLDNPDVAKILEDLSRISNASNRLAATANSLPDRISKERKAAIRLLKAFRMSVPVRSSNWSVKFRLKERRLSKIFWAKNSASKGC
jgi:hypothetical protein